MYQYIISENINMTISQFIFLSLLWRLNENLNSCVIQRLRSPLPKAHGVSYVMATLNISYTHDSIILKDE